MLGFFRKLLGLPSKEEVEAAKAREETVPYKIEAPLVNNKTGDVVDTVSVPVAAPAKKTRKPRVKKVETTVKEKAAKPRKVAAKKTVRKTKAV